MGIVYRIGKDVAIVIQTRDKVEVFWEGPKFLKKIDLKPSLSAH